MAHKSVLVSMQITTALKGHNCRSNDAHRIVKGASRLTIKEDGNELHYCLACAQTFLAKGLDRLKALQGAVDRLLVGAKSPFSG